ncbi:MAG: two-component regulator propeller domain-containing protein [Bacteroidaceae bacterium]
MNRHVRHILFLLLLLWGGRPAWADEQPMHGLTEADGLSDLLVNAIYKDSLGYVWFGTGISLDRFDGIHIKSYPLTGSDEKRKRVNAMAETEAGLLWMGNGKGLWRLQRQHDLLEQVLPSDIDSPVHALLPGAGGTLYVGSEKGLFVYRDGLVEQVLLDKNILSPANAVRGLTFGPTADELWIATMGGLFSFRPADKRLRAYHNQVSADTHACEFTGLARIGQCIYLATMGQGVFEFDIPSSRFSQLSAVDSRLISSLSTDGRNLLYVGTDGDGVHFVDVARRKVVRSLRHKVDGGGALRSNSVYSLLVDRDGLVWVGFYQHGVDYTLYQNNRFEIYTFPPHFDSNNLPIRALSIRGGERLIGSRNGFYYIDESARRFCSFHMPQIRSNMVFCICPYQGRYYVGTYGGGLYVFDPQDMSLRDFDAQTEYPFVRGHIFCLRTDRQGLLWMGTSQGVYAYRGDRLRHHFSSANSKLPEGNVYEIFFDSTGKGWICTENGLCLWNPSTGDLRTDVFPEGFIHREKIRVVYEDSRHRLYFFPDKGPLFVSDLSMSRFHRLQPGTPLEGRDGLFLMEDADHQMWIGTNGGLFRHDLDRSFVPYGFIDGIPSPVFTLCPPVCDEQGDLWFGNTKGLLRLKAGHLHLPHPHAYETKVTEVCINGKYGVSLHPGREKHLRLLDSQNNLTFRFSDFTYSDPTYLAYEYRLDGEDDDWLTLNGRSEATYYGLSSGRYTFRVRRMGQPDTEATLSLSIARPLYHWFLGAALIAMLLGGGWRFYVRIKRMRRSMPAADEDPKPENAPADKPEAGKPAAHAEKYRTVSISPEACKRLAKQLDDLMRREKPYIHPELKIADLAARLGVSAHTLSYLFNQHLQRSYYDYVNDYRIEEFKRLVATEDPGRYTLSALAEQCGFSSRASFFRYFKKATGITPNEYISHLEK